MDDFIRNSGMYRKMIDTHTDDDIIATIKQKIAETIPLDEFEQIYTFTNNDFIVNNLDNIITIYEFMDFSNIDYMCILNIYCNNIQYDSIRYHDSIQEYLNNNYVNQIIAMALHYTDYMVPRVIITDENSTLYTYSDLLRNITHLKTTKHTYWIIPIIAKYNALTHLQVHNYTVSLGYQENLNSLKSVTYINSISNLDNALCNILKPLEKLEIPYSSDLPLFDMALRVDTLIINITYIYNSTKSLDINIHGVNNLILNIIDNSIFRHITIKTAKTVHINFTREYDLTIKCSKDCVVTFNKMDRIKFDFV
jgi:hypothetical protein